DYCFSLVLSVHLPACLGLAVRPIKHTLAVRLAATHCAKVFVHPFPSFVGPRHVNTPLSSALPSRQLPVHVPVSPLSSGKAQTAQLALFSTGTQISFFSSSFAKAAVPANPQASTPAMIALTNLAISHLPYATPSAPTPL
ncbi:MAG: hypothetical protein QGF38_04770, partial [Rhodospirillales bacterium]|nr:hypothetical protein [Rhodospirillales bacterium]